MYVWLVTLDQHLCIGVSILVYSPWLDIHFISLFSSPWNPFHYCLVYISCTFKFNRTFGDWSSRSTVVPESHSSRRCHGGHVNKVANQLSWQFTFSTPILYWTLHLFCPPGLSLDPRLKNSLYFLCERGRCGSRLCFLKTEVCFWMCQQPPHL